MGDWGDRYARLLDNIRVWSSGDDPEPPVGTTVRTAHERSYTRHSTGWGAEPLTWRRLMAEGPLVEMPSCEQVALFEAADFPLSAYAYFDGAWRLRPEVRHG